MSQQVDAFARLQSENAELRARLAEAEKTIGELRQRPSLPQSMVGPIAAEVCHEPWVAPSAKRFGSVTDSQDAENQCHPDRHLLEMVLFHMPGPVSLIRGDNLRLLFINPAYRAIAPFKEMLGRTLDEIWPETGRDFSSICRRVLETGEPYTVVDELNTIRRSPDGPLDRAYFSWSLHRVPLPGTAGWSLLNLAWETTERQQAAENRRTAYDSFRHLVENSPFGVYVVDSDFQLVQVSAGAQKVFSQVRPLLGRDFADVLRIIWPEPFASEAIGHFRKTLQTGETYRAPNTVERRRDIGEIESYDWKIDRVILPDGRYGVVCHFYDLSERQRYETALRDSEERFRMLADNISQFAWIADEKGSIHWYNRRWFEYTGTTLQEVQGWGWTRVHHPDHVDRVVAHLQRSWDTGESWEDTFPLRGKDGTYRWFLSRAQPIRDEQGRILRWFGTNTDVTDLRALEATLREQDRRKDEFLAMLAHELRNPLAPISNAVHILRLIGPKDLALDETRDTIERQVKHLVRLVDDLLDVSRVSRGKIHLERNVLDLVAVARQAVETSRPLIQSRHHQLTLSLPEDPVFVKGDSTRLIQVVANLLNNAAKYTDTGGRIRLSVTVENTSAERANAVVRVADNGRGIDPKTLCSLFDLFYQADRNLDRSDGGLGIGLSLVRSLVAMHDGQVEALSLGHGHGSEFVVRLPLLEIPKPASSSTTASDARSPECRDRILVVDDNRDSAESMAMLLRLEGHTVMTAWDGRAAVDIALREHPTVVLLDIGLPLLDGYEVCRAIRQGGLDETLIIAMTGYGQDDDRRRSREASFDAHLVKPVDLPTVRRVLATRNRP